MIAAGGTGGHVYPALAIAEALVYHGTDAALTFVGGVDDFARPLVEAAKLPFEHMDRVRSGPLHGVPLIKKLISLVQLSIGTVQAIALVRKRRPSAILLTGGWVGLPIALAARFWRVPSLIYLPDIEPGLTIKALRHIVNRVAVTAPDSQQYFRAGQTVVTGYPVRKAMIDAVQGDARAQGFAHFGLDPNRKTLMIFGGSRGARSINDAVLKYLVELLGENLQIIHVTGAKDWDAVCVRRDALVISHPDIMQHYHPFAYLHEEMALAFAAADLVLSRSGASVLGEFPLYHLPSILVPYPYAWRYQKVNADWLAERGAAIVMVDDTMSSTLLPTIRELFFERPEKLEQMRTASAALSAMGDGAWNVAVELLRLSGETA